MDHIHASAHGHVREYVKRACEHIYPMSLLTMKDVLRCEDVLRKTAQLPIPTVLSSWVLLGTQRL